MRKKNPRIGESSCRFLERLHGHRLFTMVDRQAGPVGAGLMLASLALPTLSQPIDAIDSDHACVLAPMPCGWPSGAVDWPESRRWLAVL